jgi:hypothetical protein
MARVYLEPYTLSKMKKPSKALERPVTHQPVLPFGCLVPAKQRRCVGHK